MTQILGYRRAMALLRVPGTRLIKTHGLYGGAHHVVPNGGHVEPHTAEQIKRHPQVQAGEDGLFPGHSQTWRIVSAANAPSRTG